jgi:hypothetical protein
MEGDRAYCRRRASEEKAAALKAIHPKARKAHLELAQRFEDLSCSISAQETRLGLNLDQPTTA